jgi:predicted Zn-dependent protease
MFMRIAGVVAVLALVTGCATSTAPGAIGVDRSQLMMVPSATINAQAAEGFAKLTTEEARAGRLDADLAMTKRVRDIAGQLISQVSVFRPEAVSWNWQVHVIESPKVNAYCMPGGKIAIFSGLIKRLDLTDAELAAVIGHEIAHALREHSREKVSQQMLSDAVVQAVARSQSRYSGIYAVGAQLGSVLFVQLPYSREMESEADLVGLELMARAGYDPKAAANVWSKMQRLAGSAGGVEFLSTHPSHESRILVLESSQAKVERLYSTAMASRTGAPGPIALAAPQSRPTAMASPSQAPRASLSSSATPAFINTAASTLRRTGESSFEIARMGKAKNCNPNELAILVSKEPGIELYTYQCKPQETWKLRCEFRQCRIVE